MHHAFLTRAFLTGYEGVEEAVYANQTDANCIAGADFQKQAALTCELKLMRIRGSDELYAP